MTRMESNNIPKEVFRKAVYGTRLVGRPKRRWKDNKRQDVMEFGADPETFQAIAQDRMETTC